ncbi:MAG TPA: DUF4440 domain-containing protein [Gemmatimonadales bacterium]
MTALLATVILAAACTGARGSSADDALTDRERRQIAEAVERRLREATDVRAGGDVVERMLDIYPDTGRVVSASGGQASTTRDSLAAAVRSFWTYTGRNMRNPEWRWGPMLVDVLSRDAAVVTATYRIPHLTPRGAPHVIGGAWTAVFVRRDGEWVVIQEHLSDDARELGAMP